MSFGPDCEWEVVDEDGFMRPVRYIESAPGIPGRTWLGPRKTTPLPPDEYALMLTHIHAKPA